MKRRRFIGRLAAMGGLVAGRDQLAAAAPPTGDARAYMVDLLVRMAMPVLRAMAKGQLQKTFPVELSPVWRGADSRLCYLECFGRLLAGIAPWLALPDSDSEEGRLRRQMRELALQGIAQGVDPASPDYLAWRAGNQVLVDSSYLTNALLRAPAALWEPLSARTKRLLVAEIRGARRFQPPYNNWLLFAAMNEVWLASVGEDGDIVRLGTGVKKTSEWYAGDGWIKDGEAFHFDYYNSYVMWPMQLEILEQMTTLGLAVYRDNPASMLALTLQRTQRYCEHLERLVSPEGTFPVIGRSLTYRTAAFQPLALLAWRKQLPASLPEGQVRAALHAVHRTIWTNPSNFTADGFLTLGFAGHNPGLADWYSNNGSTYIASTALLALGLPPTDTYWTTAALAWTQKKAFANAPFPRDYAVDY
ncbi:DUF2264 domain-containing protein [Pseudoduganella lutea]|uniref:DUF2264 domain-containing protein n=1 Tax=Pseudoduganella lutea TaxID=321985 RepID=A0A4P6KX71_9BURK|nr:DUF2264 domain-containing protein [Pseudoduganella lutea]QBE63547.1 DUF2264 domain-containing protein [Pseudoduganella lutea]